MTYFSRQGKSKIIHDDRESISAGAPASGLISKASIQIASKTNCFIYSGKGFLVRSNFVILIILESIIIEDYHDLIAKLTQTLQQQGLLDITEDEVKEFAVDFINMRSISWLFGDCYHQDLPDILCTTETNKLNQKLNFPKIETILPMICLHLPLEEQSTFHYTFQQIEI